MEPVPVDKLSARSLIIIFNPMSSSRLIIQRNQFWVDAHTQENTSIKSRAIHVCQKNLLSAFFEEIFCILEPRCLTEGGGGWERSKENLRHSFP